MEQLLKAIWLEYLFRQDIPNPLNQRAAKRMWLSAYYRSGYFIRKTEMKYCISARCEHGMIYLAAWRTIAGDIEFSWEENIHYANKFYTREDASYFIQKHLSNGR